MPDGNGPIGTARPTLRFVATPDDAGNLPSGDELGFSAPDFNLGGASDNGDGGGNDGDGPGRDNGDGDDYSFDPERHISRDKRNADGSYRRKRRRRGSLGGSEQPVKRSAGGKKASVQASIDGLASALIVVHVGLAGITRTPELELDKDDADLLARSTANVLAEYDVVVDPKTAAIMGLLFAVGRVYGPKVALRNMRVKEAKQAAKEAAENNIEPFAGYPG